VELFRYFFVDATSVANSNNPDTPTYSVDGIDNTKAPHLIFPQPLQLSTERLTDMWGHAESPQGLTDAVLHLWRKVSG
jgi:hypothetical protein